MVATESVDEKGKVLFRATSSIFVRGEGGFGGDRGPSGAKNAPPDRTPDKSVSYKTLPQQALIYRLSGDMNPLHADPDFAKMGGFDVPILHGLCTYGHAGRAVLAAYCDNDPGAPQVVRGPLLRRRVPRRDHHHRHVAGRAGQDRAHREDRARRGGPRRAAAADVVA